MIRKWLTIVAKTREVDSYLVVIYFTVQKIKDGLHLTLAESVLGLAPASISSEFARQ